MRVVTRGEGSPAVAIVGGIHGDEPCGPTAVQRTLETDMAYARPVAFVVANQAAIAAGTRFVDTDLNRAFPGDTAGECHEARLAADLTDRFGACETLALHSTQSYGGGFAIVDEIDAFTRAVCPRLSIDAIVTAEAFVDGRIFAGIPRAIEVECGYQGSQEATDRATTITREFLAATDAIDDPAEPATEIPVFALRRAIEKEPATTYEVFARNFEKVAAGEPFAAADGNPIRASEPFYPVLLSADGYESLFGYAADRIGTLP